MTHPSSLRSFFFFNDTATTEIYTLSLHDALPISHRRRCTRIAGPSSRGRMPVPPALSRQWSGNTDRKSTRLNSSHSQISYAVFCLKKKTQTIHDSYHDDAGDAIGLDRQGAL